ncbi:hypothetical protein P872_10235 [Rhodonellum psychrophilum GCM71 = DSM 17998]|uniref:GH16 domain-containing protein n=2 Tax=Rhodonellum TaxID=336827 RepID=U5BVB4_9BACT|nr:hypothetical protein P872_10235 [Rhodonellum psychrophilum GCM71 = DSM 17998]SDZ29483.1 Glycosyl hydrolases family 16 [Rhodonellum ikkaensis]
MICKIKLPFLLVLLLLTFISCKEDEKVEEVLCDPCESPLSYEGYNLVWNDEFEGSNLSANWTSDFGDGCPLICGWGTNELQYYQTENTEIKEGFLIITAKKETVLNSNYTSSRIKTENQKTFTFGRIDIRAQLPKGQGIWPGIWMLGENINEVGWPSAGQINIAEMIGGKADGKDNTIFGAIYWGNNGDSGYKTGTKRLSKGVFNDKPHVFSLSWDNEKIVWLLDNSPYFEMDIRSASFDAFRKPFFLLFNVAVGGDYVGNPDASTVFPQQMKIDYIRVFQKTPG